MPVILGDLKIKIESEPQMPGHAPPKGFPMHSQFFDVGPTALGPPFCKFSAGSWPAGHFSAGCNPSQLLETPALVITT
jgi:hypothetical protein